jgi:LacI family transcriptional regulator
MNGAYEDMKELIAQRKKLPEAFFAGNDIMAIGCMRAMQEAGYRVPEDVSVIGMDDTSICLACTPQLSTVHVFRRELGQTVVRTLFSLPEEKNACWIKTEVGVELVMRDSVKTK